MASDSPASVVGEVDADLTADAVDALWSGSGAGWLTDRRLGVPGDLVRRVAGLTRRLEMGGCDLDGLVGAGGLGFLAERAPHLDLSVSGLATAGGAGRMIECGDGWLAVSVARADDVDSLSAWLGRPIDGLDWAAMAHAASDARVDDLVERASLLGMPCSAVGEVLDGRPGLAVEHGAAPPSGLDGALVVNLASLWAGPLAADLLARQGARVVTVESVSRPDGTRQTPAFFRALHGRSESVALDFSTAVGRRALEQLVHAADIVIEGSRPRALRQLGIEAEALVGRPGGPQVWLSITAHGRSGSGAERVGFGDDAAAAGGLVGWVDGAPHFVADAVADPVTGLTAAVAAIELMERGGRWLVDLAMARIARSVSGGWSAPSRFPLAPPRARRDPGGDLPLGRDTDAVMAGLAYLPHAGPRPIPAKSPRPRSSPG